MIDRIGSVTRRNVLKGAAAGGLAIMLRPAFAAEPIKIGFGMSLTGPNAGAGKMFLLGREIWKDEANANGGLLGAPRTAGGKVKSAIVVGDSAPGDKA